jgi:hypothetical protein
LSIRHGVVRRLAGTAHPERLPLNRNENTVKYMLLIATDSSATPVANADGGYDMNADYYAFTQRIIASGELVAGDPLHDVSTATTVRVRSGVTSVTDGPFAETKEQLGGYYIVDVASLDRALELAAEIPGAKIGSVEVRPIMDMSGM